ncbi:MAG: hypothetical protein JWN69_693 [Alphaproteobacteria bacterium]|nr:hypothetical protein [Alphaproteobacteria bacterium]
MNKLAIFEKAGRIDVAARGHHVVYRSNETNRCPGCGRANWYVGRITAECSFCGTAIALAEAKLWADGRVEASRYASDPLTEIDWEERRRHERIKAAGRTLQMLVDGSPHSFALRNLSAGGLMGDDPVGLAPNTALEVRFEGGIIVPAHVRWIEGDLLGLAFSAPLPAQAATKWGGQTR